MELTLANIISNLLILPFKSLDSDHEYFFSRFNWFLQNLQKVFPTIQVSNSCEVIHQVSLCNTNKTCGDEKVGDSEKVGSVMSRLGMAFDIDYESVVEEDFLELFDEEEPSFEEIKETFGFFDVNKDGFIDCSDLQRVIWDLGLKKGCDLEDCRRMIKAFDDNGDGLIDFHEFVKFMEKCLC